MKRFVAYVVLVMVFAHITLNYSWFGTSERSDKYVQDLVNTYLGSGLYPSSNQNITVLLLTDQAVDTHQGGHWPASYDFHGRVLNTMFRHRPAAVFIDFLWLSQRPKHVAEGPRDGDYLIKTLQRYQSSNIPVYLAGTPAVERNWPELKGLVTYVGAQLDIDFVDFVSRSYPVMHNGLPTPAFQIAQDLLPGLFSRSPRQAMEVFWGTSPNKKNQSWMTGQVVDTDVVDVLMSGYSGVSTSVPFSTTLFVRDLLNPVASSPEQANAEADAFLKNKIVLYGANLTGVNDVVFTPTRDILPGVYLHAMALDNLLHWGDGYKSTYGSGLFSEKPWRDIWSLAIVFPVAVLFVLLHSGLKIDLPFTRLGEQRKRLWGWADKHPWLSHIIIALMVAIWFAGWALVEFSWFGVSAATVAGYIEFITLGFFLGKLGLLDWIARNVLIPAKNRVLAYWRRRPHHKTGA